MSREDMVAKAAEAIRLRSEQIGETVGWSGDIDVEFAVAAVDAVLEHLAPPF